jgi:hypothetical protein
MVIVVKWGSVREMELIGTKRMEAACSSETSVSPIKLYSATAQRNVILAIVTVENLKSYFLKINYRAGS